MNAVLLCSLSTCHDVSKAIFLACLGVIFCFSNPLPVLHCPKQFEYWPFTSLFVLSSLHPSFNTSENHRSLNVVFSSCPGFPAFKQSSSNMQWATLLFSFKYFLCHDALHKYCVAYKKKHRTHRHSDPKSETWYAQERYALIQIWWKILISALWESLG